MSEKTSGYTSTRMAISTSDNLYYFSITLFPITFIILLFQ
jgi:hypothetical protein